MLKSGCRSEFDEGTPNTIGSLARLYTDDDDDNDKRRRWFLRRDGSIKYVCTEYQIWLWMSLFIRVSDRRLPICFFFSPPFFHDYHPIDGEKNWFFMKWQNWLPTMISLHYLLRHVWLSDECDYVIFPHGHVTRANINWSTYQLWGLIDCLWSEQLYNTIPEALFHMISR